MTVEYKNLNSLVLAPPPHHTRARLNVIVVEAEGYPKTTKAKRKTGKDANGITTWEPVGHWRGLDPRLVRGYNKNIPSEE